MPTANTPAASLKSRRNASTVAATASARPIRLIATARPVLPAFAAASSSELAPCSEAAARVASAPGAPLTAPRAETGAISGKASRQTETPIAGARLAARESTGLYIGVGLDRGHLPPALGPGHVQFVGERVASAPFFLCLDS